MKTKLLISTAMVATAFCVNAAQAENPPANMSNDRYVYPTVDGGTYTMTNAVLESGNDAEWADPVDMLIKNAKITATDSDIESTGKLTIDGSTISVISTKITNEQLEPWIRYGEEDEDVMDELYGIYARDDIDIVDSQISLTRSYINANSELKDGNLTISDTENDDKPTSLTLTNSRIDTGAIDVKGGEINIKDSAMHGMFDITVSGGVTNIDNGELTVDVGSPVDDVYTQGKLTISGGEINLKNGGSIGVEIPDEGVGSQGTVEMTGGKINVVNKGDVVTKEFNMTDGELNIAQGAAFDVIKDAYLDESDKVVISEYSDIVMGDDAVINLEGNLNTSGISGTGTLNFNAANAVVDGDVENVNVTFNADNTLSKAITGEVSGKSLNITKGTIVLDNDEATFNSLNISGGTANVNDDFYVSTLQNPNGGDITISNGTVNLNGYSLNAMSGGITVSGGIVNIKNVGEDPDNTLWAAKDINITGGVVNMEEGSSIDTFYDWLDEGGNQIDKPEQPGNIYISGGTVNVNGKSAEISSEGEIEVSDGGVINIAEGASLESYSSYSIVDGDMEEGDKATIYLRNNGTINVSGKLIADVDGTDAGALNFNAANAVVDGDVENVNVTFNADNTLSKAITGSLDYVTSLNIAKGTLIFDRAVSLASLNVASVLDAGLNKVEIDGDANFAATSTLKIEIAEDDNGSFKANNINVDDGAKLAFNITKKMEIGEELKDVALLDGNLNGVFKNQLPNSRYTITSEDNKVFNISYDASASDVVIDAGGSSGNAATAEAWDSLLDLVDKVAEQIKSLIVLLSDLSQNATTAAGQKAYVNALTALAPETAPAIQQAATEGANQIFGAVGTRLSGGSVASSRRGMSSGDNPFTKVAVWVQGLFNKAKLDDTKASKGFDSKTYGTAMGIEGKLNEEVKLGLGYAYSKTDIDGFMRDTDAKTHTAIVYGEYKPSDWYVNMVASYGWSKYNEKKKVGVMTVKSDWDVESLAVQVMTGYQFNIDGFGITPELGLRYIHIKQDGYKDTADQRVLGSNSDILTGVLGTKVAKSWALENGMLITPEIKAAMTYDMKNDKGGSVVKLANGSTYAVSGKAMNRFGVELGAGVTAEINDNVELSLGYEGKFRDNYADHTGLINAKYKF